MNLYIILTDLASVSDTIFDVVNKRDSSVTFILPLKVSTTR